MSRRNAQPKNLQDVLDTLRELAHKGHKVSVEDVQDTVGQRSFAPARVAHDGLFASVGYAAATGSLYLIARSLIF